MSKQRIAIAALVFSLAGAVTLKSLEGTGPTAIAETGETISKAYPDPAHGWAVPTICSGHTRAVFKGQIATQSQCEQWLIEDTAASSKAIKRCTPVAMTQGQYDAIVMFVHNIGPGAYCASKFARELNAGKCLAAANEINNSPQLLPGGWFRLHAGNPIRNKATGQILLNHGDPIMKWTTANGQPMPGLILRRNIERAQFESGCTAW